MFEHGPCLKSGDVLGHTSNRRFFWEFSMRINKNMFFFRLRLPTPESLGEMRHSNSKKVPVFRAPFCFGDTPTFFKSILVLTEKEPFGDYWICWVDPECNLLVIRSLSFVCDEIG